MCAVQHPQRHYKPNVNVPLTAGNKEPLAATSYHFCAADLAAQKQHLHLYQETQSNKMVNVIC